jgi:hypothetical protein
MQRLLHLILIVLVAVASVQVTASPAQAQAPSQKDVIFRGPTFKWRGPSVDWSHGRLRVNSGNRYLEHADGTPFPWVGDTVWELTNKITLAQAELLGGPEVQGLHGHSIRRARHLLRHEYERR